MPKPNPEQLELPFEDHPKFTLKDMMNRVADAHTGGCQVDQSIRKINSIKPIVDNTGLTPWTDDYQRSIDYFKSTDKKVDHEKLIEIDVTTFQEEAEGKRTFICDTKENFRKMSELMYPPELPAEPGEVYYEVGVKLNEFQMRKLDELATFHHLDKEKALVHILEEFEVKARVPKSETCRDVKREQGRQSKEAIPEWKIKDVMRRRTTCTQESDRTYVGNKSCKIFPGKDGRKKARRWLAEKIVIEEGL